MRVGSIVQTTNGFKKERAYWGFSYPKKGDVLTISAITPHANPNVNKKGIVLLYFEETPNLIGLCDKTVNGNPNFIELKLADEIKELLELELELEHN